MARLELSTGKGGVGKTTLAAALALEAARRGRKPLVVELGHRASLSAIFDVPIGFAPVEVSPGVHATNIALAPALLDYLTRRIRVASVARRIAALAGSTSNSPLITPTHSRYPIADMDGREGE